MEDLAAAVQSILNDPQSMAQLQGVMNSLGMNPPQAPAPATPPVQQKPAAAAPLNLLNTLNNSDPMTAMLLRAAPLLASANREDDSTRLLAALRPLLGEARQKKLDEASKILKLLHLLPLLKESGVLQNILEERRGKMPSNMPDARAVEEALRRAREMQGRSAHNAPPPPEKPTEESPQGNAETSTEIPKEFQAAPNRPLSPLDTLLKDKERTLLLALLLLLYNEGGSAELLFALFYLLI